jgi:hypothetical protein
MATTLPPDQRNAQGDTPVRLWLVTGAALPEPKRAAVYSFAQLAPPERGEPDSEPFGATGTTSDAA